MAKASSNDILGLGKPLRSGQGAIRQFRNPIKPAKAPAAAWLKPAPTTFWAWGSLWDRDRGPSVKPHKTSHGASRSMAKASSNDILGLGKPLRSGQGAIRQFRNPIKPAKAPAAAWLKPAPTTFWAWGSLWDRDRGPSVKPHKTSHGASRSMAKASSNDILGLGKPLRSGQGAIRQFWNPIKPERGPAAAWVKPAPTTFWAWGSLWDRDKGPSVSFETP